MTFADANVLVLKKSGRRGNLRERTVRAFAVYCPQRGVNPAKQKWVEFPKFFWRHGFPNSDVRSYLGRRWARRTDSARSAPTSLGPMPPACGSAGALLIAGISYHSVWKPTDDILFQELTFIHPRP